MMSLSCVNLKATIVNKKKDLDLKRTDKINVIQQHNSVALLQIRLEFRCSYKDQHQILGRLLCEVNHWNALLY